MADPGTKAGDTDDLRRQLETVRNDVRILAEMANAQAGARAESIGRDARERAEELSEETRARLRAARDRAETRGREAYDETEAVIRRHPFAAVGAALAAGWLLGSLFRR